MRNSIVVLALLLIVNSPVGAAWSQSVKGIAGSSEDPEGQVVISADKAEGRSLPGGYETVFRGNVKVRQADMTLTCDRLVTFYEQKTGSNNRSDGLKVPMGDGMNTENLRTITAIGHVKIVQRDTTATAGKAEYKHGKRTVTLTESPRLRQGPNELQAHTLIIALNENRLDFGVGGRGAKPGIRSANGEISKDNGTNAENLKTITAVGQVRIVQRDATASAGEALYDHSKRSVTLTDDPRLRQGSNVLHANTIIVHLDENRVDFEGGDRGIKGTLSPGGQKKQEKK